MMTFSKILRILILAVVGTVVVIVAVCPDPMDPDDQAGAYYRSQNP
jgi:hypothetical protein